MRSVSVTPPMLVLVMLSMLMAGVIGAPPAGYYQNPLQTNNCPDPGAFVQINGTYYVATTSQVLPAFPIRASNDLVNWEVVSYVFPEDSTTKPSWAIGDFWAPEIHYLWGTYVVVFAAQDTEGVLSVGLAYSTGDILGPYVDIGHPIFSNVSMGNIDPTIAMDRGSGSVYLVWKVDGNGHVPQVPTLILAQELTSYSDNTFTLVGDITTLIQEDLPWEGALVEAPWIVYVDQGVVSTPYYYLFYSANAYYNASYAVGVARSTSLLGPYEKSELPIVHSNDYWVGPGHCSVVPAPSQAGDSQTYTGTDLVMIYHSWQANGVGGDNPRMLLMDAVIWEDDWPLIANNTPSIAPQKVPFVY